MHRRKGRAVGRLPSWCGDGRPKKPAPPLPQIVRSGRDARHRNCRRPDLVRYVLAYEDHFDRRGRSWPLAAKTGNADEEVQAAHVSGCGIVDGRETTTTQSSEDHLRGAADQHHRDGGIDRAAAAGEYVSPRLCGRWVPGGDAGANPHRSSFLTRASLMVAILQDR